MRTIIAAVLAVGLVAGLAGPSDAGSKKRHYYDDSSQGYLYATPRQMRNARAYDQAGQYYEADSKAFPMGSRGWWEMKRLEGSSGRPR
jgi:outer membrane protein assembly factor BamD (BamD/ComL family)